jgi:hypothetical protein
MPERYDIAYKRREEMRTSQSTIVKCKGILKWKFKVKRL